MLPDLNTQSDPVDLSRILSAFLRGAGTTPAKPILPEQDAQVETGACRADVRSPRIIATSRWFGSASVREEPRWPPPELVRLSLPTGPVLSGPQCLDPAFDEPVPPVVDRIQGHAEVVCNLRACPGREAQEMARALSASRRSLERPGSERVIFCSIVALKEDRLPMVTMHNESRMAMTLSTV